MIDRLGQTLASRGGLGMPLMTALVTVMVAAICLSFVWKGPGKNLVRLHEDIQELQMEYKRSMAEISESRKRFLEGEEAEILKSYFEEDASFAEYFNLAFEELDRRSPTGLALRTLTTEPAENTNDVSKLDFEMEFLLDYPETVSYIAWLEEAYPVYLIHGIEMRRSDGDSDIRTLLRGSLIMPR